ncbi:uncharacterized protein LOC119026906 isoform X3 [Acanthopagrus latus]|uniref:uncharacterized protein LOC119026906 isoform X3 n=1 Tax=Acanthopagrus latus TaxID=8177 RepID=UPI00187CE481|nr:uncharacterized protein LOC119026906 isoform X3 [Acanthopagrus latus]
MICRILLLISLNCVCGTFVVNVTQTSYQAEENHNITLEWTFTTTADTPTDSLYIFCEMINDHKVSVLFEIRGGVEVPESRDQQFVGRVQWDKDVLRDGRLRLHVSRLRTEDSGRCRCKVWRNNILNSSDCWLSVSAARDQPKPERPKTASRGMIGLYCVLGLIIVVSVLVICYFLIFHSQSDKQQLGSDCGGGSEGIV